MTQEIHVERPPTMPIMDRLRNAGVLPPAPLTPPPGPVTIAAAGLDDHVQYVQAAVRAECEKVAQAAEGTRNDTLNTAAFNLGTLVHGGHLDRRDAHTALRDAGMASGLSETEVERTIRSGFTGAEKSPRTIPDREPIPGGFTIDPATGSAVEDPERAHTSWWPVDLGGVLSGDIIDEPPTELTRSDGQRLFYPGRVNGILGPSESGKTWVALAAVKEAAEAGRNVIILDFEDTPVGVINRLKALGVDPAVIARHIRYISPDEALTAAATGDLDATLLEHRPAIILVDGVNAAMTLLGLDLISNKDATSFHQGLLKPLAATGAAVITVDHIPKSKLTDSAGGIGAQAKRAMTTGAAYRVEVVAPFGRGKHGKLKVTVDKDRAGHVRGACPDAKTVGIANIISADDGQVTVTIDVDTSSHDDDGNFRPTILMSRVSEYLAKFPAGLSGKAIEEGVNGRAAFIRTAIEHLVTEEYVERSTGPRNAILHRLTRPFSAQDIAPVTPSSSLVPTSSPVVPDELTSDLVPAPRSGPDGTRSTTPGRAEARPESQGHIQRIDGHLVDMRTGEIIEESEQSQ